MENAKIQNFKCDILRNFQTMCPGSISSIVSETYLAHADVVYDKTVANNGHYNDETNCQALNGLTQEVNFKGFFFLVF